MSKHRPKRDFLVLDHVLNNSACDFNTGEVSGLPSRVFVSFGLNGKLYNIPRSYIVWAHKYKKWPNEKLILDHKDGNSYNDSPSNLEEVTRSQNSLKQKCKRNKKNNLPKGVYYRKDWSKYIVRLTINNKTVFMDNYFTIEEAIYWNSLVRKCLIDSLK